MKNRTQKKSDFNNDGKVDLVDFGIWRNSFFPSTSFKDEAGTILSNAKKLLVGLFSEVVGSPVNAQENTNAPSGQGTGENSSQPVPDTTQDTNPQLQVGSGTGVNSTVVTTNGTSSVFNTNPNGTLASAMAFDLTGNQLSTLYYDGQGNLRSRTMLLASGDEVNVTSADGVNIETLKKADGPLIQFFKDGQGNLLVTKSWSDIASMERGDPPISVSVPVSGGNRMILSISPNGASILAETDDKGSIRSESHLKPDGTYFHKDLLHRVLVEANNQIGFATIHIQNTSDAVTNYHFYKSGLFAIVHHKGNDHHIAIPLNNQGSSWDLESRISGQVSHKTVGNPIQELNITSLDPLSLITAINQLKSRSQFPVDFNFKDALGNSPKVSQSQVTKADEFLKSQNSATVDANSSSADSAAAAIVPASTIAGTSEIGVGNLKSEIEIAEDGTETAKIIDPTRQEGQPGYEIAKQVTPTGGQGSDWSSGNQQVTANYGAVTQAAGVYSSSIYPATTYRPLATNQPTEQPQSGGTCFLAGTKISTPNGSIAIEKLNSEDLVYSYNEKTGTKEISRFRDLDINFVDEYLIINGKIQTTIYHPFYYLDLDSKSMIKYFIIKVSQPS